MLPPSVRLLKISYKQNTWWLYIKNISEHLWFILIEILWSNNNRWCLLLWWSCHQWHDSWTSLFFRYFIEWNYWQEWHSYGNLWWHIQKRWDSWGVGFFNWSLLCRIVGGIWGGIIFNGESDFNGMAVGDDSFAVAANNDSWDFSSYQDLLNGDDKGAGIADGYSIGLSVIIGGDALLLKSFIWCPKGIP